MIDDRISQVHLPLLKSVEKLDNVVSNTRKLSRSWIYSPNDEDKNELKHIHDHQVALLLDDLKGLNDLWENRVYQDSLKNALSLFQTNLQVQKEMMGSLQNAIDYESIDVIFPIIEMFDQQIVPELTHVSQKLKLVNSQLETASSLLIKEKYESFDTLEAVMIWLNIFAAIVGVGASFLTTGSIVGPVKKLNEIIQKLVRGELSDFEIRKSNDEVGEMVQSIQSLKDGLKRTSEFASEIGQGNLDEHYDLLSESDVLGKSLISMRDNLKEVIYETNQVVGKAGNQGDLSARINIDNKKGAWKDLGNSINDLLGSIAIPVIRVNEVVNAMAKGDLTKRYTVKAEGEIRSLADNLNSALENLNDLLHQIAKNANAVDESASEMQASSEEMNGSTGEIASSIAQMSNGAQTQVGKVDESSNLVEGILKSSTEMGDRAKTINEGVNNVVMSSVTGQKMLDEVVANMAEISNNSVKTNESMEILTTRSGEITRVLSVITEIASQTNLLALNAAIEAAQAGDAGRGFAVVAEEIRKLAEDSKNSAQEIESLIEAVQKDTKEAAKITETMSEGVQVGEATSQEAAEMFRKIAERAGKNLSLSEGILKATEVQQNDIRAVVSNTENIVVIAEQTAAGTEEIASSASELSSGMETYMQKSERLTEIASELKSGVSKFKLSRGQESGSVSVVLDKHTHRINPN